MRVTDSDTLTGTQGHAEHMEALVPACERYSITPTDADMLQGVAAVGGELRGFLLRQYADNHGVEALVGLFGEFIGLANRLATNATEAAVVVLIAEGLEPHEAERLNAPTVIGALEGIKLAAGVDSKPTCGGCAFRQGTVANMSPLTTADATDCVPAGGAPFMCHAEMTAGGEPIKACAGWAQARKRENHDAT